MTLTEQREDERHTTNRNAALRWGAFVVGMLSLQVIGGVIAIMLASDESVAIVPNYHQKALDWDGEVAIRTASKRLGWIAEMNQTDGAGNLQIRLRDASGDLVEIESGEIEMYRHFRAGDIHRLRIPAGVAAIDVDDCFPVGGLWQVTLDVRDALGNRFVDSQVIDVVLASSAASSEAL